MAEEIRAIPANYWQDRQNVWVYLQKFIERKDVEAAIFLLEIDQKLDVVSTAPFYWYILDDKKLFSQDNINLLFWWLSQKTVFTEDGIRLIVPDDISINIEEVLTYLIRLEGEGVIQVFERAEEAGIYINNEPFDEQFYRRLRDATLSFEDNEQEEPPLDDLLIERIVSITGYTPFHPNYLIETPSNLDELLAEELKSRNRRCLSPESTIGKCSPLCSR